MAFVQAVHASNDAAGTTLSVNITATSGNLICAKARHDGVDQATMTDGVNPTYTFVGSGQTPPFAAQDTFYAKNIIGGTLSVTMNTASDAFRRIQVAEFSGLDTVSPLTDHAENFATFATTTDACTSGNGAGTSGNGDTIVGFFENDNSTTNGTAGTGFTSHDPFTDAVGDAGIMEEKVQSGAGPTPATFTCSDAANTTFVSMLAFKATIRGWPASAGSYHPGKSPGLGGISSARFQTNWWPYSPPVTITFDPAFMAAMVKSGNDPLVLPPQVVASGMTPSDNVPS